MKRAGFAVAGVGAAVMLLAVWVTSTSTVPLLPSTGPRHHPPPISPPLRSFQKHGSHRHGKTQRNWLDDFVLHTGYGLLALAGVALVTFLVWALIARAREGEVAERVRESPEDPYAIAALDVPPEILEAAEQQLAALRDGTPRNAIVACWMELERTCSQSGFPRAASETSTEFTTRVLGQYAVEARTVRALAALYREARFSEHVLTEAHRDRALAALQDVLTDLRRHRRPTGLVPTS